MTSFDTLRSKSRSPPANSSEVTLPDMNPTQKVQYGPVSGQYLLKNGDLTNIIEKGTEEHRGETLDALNSWDDEQGKKTYSLRKFNIVETSSAISREQQRPQNSLVTEVDAKTEDATGVKIMTPTTTLNLPFVIQVKEHALKLSNNRILIQENPIRKGWENRTCKHANGPHIEETSPMTSTRATGRKCFSVLKPHSL